MKSRLVFSIGLLIGMVFSFQSVKADDVGITKARFIQLNASTYVLEADIARSLISAIGTPAFPDGFEVSEPSFSNESSWVIISFRISGSQSFKDADKIYLPWGRTGVDLTVQWQDGQIFQGLFLNKGQGIYIPISEIRESEFNLAATLKQQTFQAISHLPSGLIHLLLPLILALGWGRTVLSLENGAMAITGLGSGLFLFELGFPQIGLLYAHILEILCVILLAYYLLKKHKTKYLSWLILILITVHTMSWATEINKDIKETDQLILAVFVFEFVLRLCQLIVLLLLAWIFSFLKRVQLQQGILYSCGAYAVAILFWSYTEGIEDEYQNNRLLTSDVLVAANRVVKPQQTQGALELTKPIMAYYAVEPHEVRAEILVNARAAVKILGVDDSGKGAIPISSQETLKEYLLNGFEQRNPLKVDGELTEPVASSINFVSLTPAGVLLRAEPQPESLDEGILGLTLIYEAEGLADQLDLEWSVFEEQLREVEVSITDPFGISTRIMRPDDSVFNWQSRLPGYRIPQIGDIEVRIPKYSLLSILLVILAIVLLSLRNTRNMSRWRSIALGALTLAGLCYPFVRTEAQLPFVEIVAADKAGTEQLMEDLLSNVYRSFDVRDEGAVYDRLVISVTGEQLNRIYLENRKSMELEERGGARANVDEVLINEVSNIEENDGNYSADVAWNVGGSVSHFGHTHYRRNRYLAKVSFRIVEDTWKITDIELLDEERIL